MEIKIKKVNEINKINRKRTIYIKIIRNK